MKSFSLIAHGTGIHTL